MPMTAPSAAPDEAPRMSGETSGLRNRPWKAVPATASAAPQESSEHAGPADVPDHGLDLRRQAGWLAAQARPQQAREVTGPDGEAAEPEGEQDGDGEQRERDSVSAEGGGLHRSGLPEGDGNLTVIPDAAQRRSGIHRRAHCPPMDSGSTCGRPE